VLQCDNPFWSFSLAVYAAPGVAAECLALQDTSGVDVNVLLFCAWLGATKRSVLTLEDFAAIEAAVQPWRDTVIHPMRGVRRGIDAMPDSTNDAVAALRKDAAAVELRAEQIEQAMLYRLMPTLSAAPVATTAESATRRNVSALLSRRAPASSEPSARQLIEAALAYAHRP
jgi:uncharacterized protein (TIGR02444 family)